MAGLGGANYGVYVNFGIRNMMAGGMREVQAQLKAAQATADSVGKKTAAHLKRIQQQAIQFGGIYGNPKSYEEAKKNLDAIAKRKGQLQNALAVEASRKQRQALNDQLTALNMTQRDVAAKAKAYGYTVAEERTRLRMANAQQREQREAERARQRQIQRYRGVGDGAFQVAQYSGIGALAIGGGLFEASKAAAQQQQYAGVTALTLGYKSEADMAKVQKQLLNNAINTSMAVGMLSSADVARVQTILAQHLGLTRASGLNQLIGPNGLTLPVSQYADVMKLTTGEGVDVSTSVATRVANQFGVRNPAELKKILNSIFVMTQSTGAPQERFMNALSYFGAMGKQLGFSPEEMISLYGEAYRLGIGGGKSGQRLGAIVRGLTNMPTTTMQAYFSSMLGTGSMGILPQIQDKHGNLHIVDVLKWYDEADKRLERRYGKLRGDIMFTNALNKGGMGSSASQALFNMIQDQSIQGYLKQKARAAQFSSIDQAQAHFLGLPMGQFSLFKTNLQSAIIAFGNVGLPAFTAFFHQWAKVLERATSWMESHQTLTTKIFDGLVNLAEILGAISAASLIVGVISRIVTGFIALQKGLSIISTAMGLGSAKVVASDNALASANMRAAGSAGSVAGKMGALVGALGLIAVTYEFLKGLKINADMQKKYPAFKGSLIPGTDFGSNYAFPGAYGVDGRALKAPASQDNSPQPIILQLDGKKIGALLLNQKNRTLSSALNSTTHGQGTRYVTPYQTLQTLNAPHTR